jgi:hypothetical protein
MRVRPPHAAVGTGFPFTLSDEARRGAPSRGVEGLAAARQPPNDSSARLRFTEPRVVAQGER